MADPLRHRQTKGAATDMVDLTPPRHIPTLPIKDVQIETLPEERCVRTAEVFGRFYVIGAEADPPAKWPFPH
jgi:hypothetical protein